ncbi:MAG: hypothetical protein LBU70_01720 [Chitinispirillales bacterium]|nr:hypothetical protein [Chitinispirillales bacterium]
MKYLELQADRSPRYARDDGSSADSLKTRNARMNIALPIQTTLCCPKHYGAVSGGEATHFKKKVFKKHPNEKFGLKKGFKNKHAPRDTARRMLLVMTTDPTIPRFPPVINFNLV